MRLFQAWVVLAFAFSGGPVHGSSLPAEESYQRAWIDRALQAKGLRIDPSPEGKRIESIWILPEDVLTEQDPWPAILAKVHVTTLESVVRQELLFREGESWVGELVDETERNLRGNLFVSVARILPVRERSADQLSALVLTKDLWSLRSSFDYSYVGGRLEFFDLQLGEHNLLGRNKAVSVNYQLDLATHLLGQRYEDPRVFGSRVDFTEEFNAIWNRASGSVEGARGEVSLGQPLFSLSTEWGWRLATSFRRDVYRLFSSGEIATISIPTTGERVPYEFDRKILTGRAFLVRSDGKVSKRDLSFGVREDIRDFQMPPPAPGRSQASLDGFAARLLPRSETSLAVFASLHWYRTDYLKLEDIQTFALTEDYRVGTDALVELRANTRFLEPVVSWSENRAFGDDYFSLGIGLSARYEPGYAAWGEGAPWINQEALLSARNTSPKWGPVRFHSAVRLLRRTRDTMRDIETLGGDGRLRGYPSAFFSGSQAWGANFELRSLPLAARTVHVGAAAFLDMGDAFDSWSAATLYSSIGVGLRILFPQFNRAVIRIDAGFPLNRVEGAGSGMVVSQFGQAF